MPEIMPILAESEGKSALDMLEAIFFLVVALISVLGSVAGRFLKKKKSGDDAPVVNESVFGTIEEEDGDGNAELDCESAPWISDEEREAADAPAEENPFPSAVPATEIFPVAASVPAREFPPTVPATAAVVSVPAERKSAPERPVRSESVPAAATTDGLLDDREALRRAVLAQEILSPPLALRE